jgi:hypothetical protein
VEGGIRGPEPQLEGVVVRVFCAMLVLLLLGVSACGSDDDGTASFVPPSTTPVVGKGLPPEVRHPTVQTIDRLQRAFAKRDYRGFCAWVTPSAARSVGMAAHGEATTCERDVRRLFGLIRKGGGWRHVNAPRVVDVKVQGDTATAIVALDRRWRAQVALARRDGRWSLNGLFGQPVGPSRRLAERIDKTDFPPPGRTAVEVKDGNGTPCPELSEADYPAVKGGCRIQTAGRITPFTMLTPFGDFQFDRCSIAYRVRVDASGRTWTDEFNVEGDPKNPVSACGDVNACFDYKREELAPWRGRIYPDGRGGYVHRMDMCLQTCVGYFVGKLNMRMVRDGDSWRAIPIDGGGDTGFRFDSPLLVKGDIDLEERT